RLEVFALMNVSEITASVGMTDLRSGKYRLPIQIQTPGGVRVVSCSPNMVDFELFRMIERRLRPSLVLQDGLPDNMTLSSVDITPAEVTVKGPEASVMAVRRAEVRSTVLGVTNGARDIPVVLVNESGDVPGLSVDPGLVKVSAQFTRTIKEIKVPVTVRITGVPGGGLEVGSVTVSPDTAVLRGTEDALLGITEIAINPVDVSGHTENMNVDIPLDPPSDSVSISGTDHVNLNVELRSAIQTRTYLGVPVSLEGVDDAKGWIVTPSLAGVTVERPGPPESAFDPDRPPLELYIDATNVVTSHIVLPILTRNVQDGVQVVRVEPPQVTVTHSDR
ncbi:MAG: hypothetical protein LBR87_08455, partial [Synergistaceae bacterium]|nr:hypothetical protein [Synergistaceae bacterium]